MKRIASLVSMAHSRANERNVGVLRGMRAEPVHTVATSRLAEEQAQSRAVMAEQSGAAFDAFYLIDRVLLPQAEDASLRASLEELRDGIGRQLEAVERVRLSLPPT